MHEFDNGPDRVRSPAQTVRAASPAGAKQRWAVGMQQSAGNAALVRWGVQRWSDPKLESEGAESSLKDPAGTASAPEDLVAEDSTAATEAIEAHGAGTSAGAIGKGSVAMPVIWNEGAPYAGIVDKGATKYTMFLPDGTPVRATASLKMSDPIRGSLKKEP